MAVKMGRPLSDNPRKNIVGCKLTDDELKRLNSYCKEKSKTKSDVLLEGIKTIIDPKSESK